MFRIHSYSGLKRPDFFCLAVLAACVIGSVSPLHAQEGSSSAQQQAPSTAAELPRTTLQIGERRINVEVAADHASRAKGLMFREKLAPDHGMLFVFPRAEQLCFWMKNTPLPLSIAFVDASDTIINLADMQPQALDTHCSLGPALYAIEMEQGWFKRHGLAPGTAVQGLPRLRRPGTP